MARKQAQPRSSDDTVAHAVPAPNLQPDQPDAAGADAGFSALLTAQEDMNVQDLRDGGEPVVVPKTKFSGKHLPQTGSHVVFGPARKLMRPASLVLQTWFRFAKAHAGVARRYALNVVFSSPIGHNFY